MKVSFDSPDSLLASFSRPNGSGRLILITGSRGAGKTRWCGELAAASARLGVEAGGILSPAVFENGLKIAIDLLDLHSHTRRHLAERASGKTEVQTTGKWVFNEETLSWGNSILSDSYDSRLLILDELGPLELVQGLGLSNGIGLVNSRRYELAVVTMRPELLELVIELWPWGEVLSVEPERQLEASS